MRTLHWCYTVDFGRPVTILQIRSHVSRTPDALFHFDRIVEVLIKPLEVYLLTTSQLIETCLCNLYDEDFHGISWLSRQKLKPKNPDTVGLLQSYVTNLYDPVSIRHRSKTAGRTIRGWV